jgi:hypothetical protein
MLIHDYFRKDLIIHTNESDNTWQEYNFEYLIQMKRYVKRQLIETLGSIKGQRFMIDRPLVLHKQIPLIMAIWELGGSVIVNDLHYSLHQNSLYLDYFSSINGCFVEHGDIEFSQLDQTMRVFKDRLHELRFWDQDPEFKTITDDLIVGESSDIALVVASSGTTRAPLMVAYTHTQIRSAVEANQTIYGYRPDEHILHLKMFHHGGLCTSYFLPTLETCQHHYFKIDHRGLSLDDHAANILTSVPIDRVMIPWSVTERLIKSLTDQKCPVDQLTIQTTHTMQSIGQIDNLFATNQVARLMILFGCRELPTIFFMQDINKHNWPVKRKTWNSMVFDSTPAEFWEFAVLDEGLGVKANYMDSFYIPGDVFEQLPTGQWQWKGRNNVIKRDGHLVNPETISTVLKNHFKDVDQLVVADYEFKKIYVFVFNSTDFDLIDQFNQTIVTEIDLYHTVDLVLSLSDKDMVGQKADSTLSVLRFLARKQLNLNV